MMTPFLTTLLSLSLSGSVLAMLVWLCRILAGRRISCSAGYYLWLLVLIRLALPLALPGSLMARAYDRGAALAARWTVLQQADDPAAASSAGTFAEGTGPSSLPGGAGPEKTEPDASDPPGKAASAPGPSAGQEAAPAVWAAALLPGGRLLARYLPELLFAAWVVGALFVLGGDLSAHLRLRRTLRRAAVPPDPDDLAVYRQMFGQLDGPGRVRLVSSTAAFAPMLLGLLRPVLVLPAHAYVKTGQEAQLRCLLRHEMTHHARHDLWYKWFLLAVRAVHWFNPLLPLLTQRIEEDCELSCDEAATACMTAKERLCYGNTLLAFAGAAPLPAGLPATLFANDNKRLLRRRLLNVKHPVPRTARSVCLAVICSLFLAGCGIFLGAAQPDRELPLAGPDTKASDRPGVSSSEKEASLYDAAGPLPGPGSAGTLHTTPQEPPATAEDPPLQETDAFSAAGGAALPEDEDLVPIRDYLPDLYLDLKYASADNLTGRPLYDFEEPLLRYGTVKKLAAVQTELVQQGYSLKLWDAYRPLSAQQALWDACPDPMYVSAPRTGYLGHTRGNTVDVTLVLLDGAELEMPSGFDEFTALADRDYSDVSPQAAAHAMLLEKAMLAHGFKSYQAEWSHYSDEKEYDKITE